MEFIEIWHVSVSIAGDVCFKFYDKAINALALSVLVGPCTESQNHSSITISALQRG